LRPQDRHGITRAFAQMLVLIKHPAFREEQEWRIVIPERPIQNVLFRSVNGAPRPYVEIPIRLGNPTERPSRPLPIKKLVVGPTLAVSETSLALQQMLKKYGYGDDIEVVPSSVPFRS
jgi:hypothetical protein